MQSQNSSNSELSDIVIVGWVIVVSMVYLANVAAFITG